MRHFKLNRIGVLVLTVSLVAFLAACGGTPEEAQPVDSQPEAVQPEDVAADSSSQISLIVSSNLVQCVGVSEDCLQVKYSEENDWEPLQGQIEGFEYELGYRYVLLVEAVEPADETTGGAKVLYKLVDVQEKTKDQTVNGEDLGGTFWVLNAFGGLAQPDEVEPQAQVSFQFDPADNRISGRAGCNLYIANANVDYSLLSLEISTVGSTRMACREEVMQQELHFLKMLEQVASYAVENGVLYLFTTDGQVLTFAPGQPSR